MRKILLYTIFVTAAALSSTDTSANEDLITKYFAPISPNGFHSHHKGFQEKILSVDAIDELKRAGLLGGAFARADGRGSIDKLTFTAVGRFQFSPNITAYLMRAPSCQYSSNHVFIFLYDTKIKKLLTSYNTPVSGYCGGTNGTVESDGWLFDINGDGYLDIVNVNQTTRTEKSSVKCETWITVSVYDPQQLNFLRPQPGQPAMSIPKNLVPKSEAFVSERKHCRFPS